MPIDDPEGPMLTELFSGGHDVNGVHMDLVDAQPTNTDDIARTTANALERVKAITNPPSRDVELDWWVW